MDLQKIILVLTLPVLLSSIALLVGVGMVLRRERRLKEERDAAQKVALDEKNARETMDRAAREEQARLRQQLTACEQALRDRPIFRRTTYRIATIGPRGCGKTNLTFRCWANPLYKGRLEQTQFARYNKTVSRQVSRAAIVDHVCEVLDWGGELINEAQAALVKQDIHALLMVVDLGDPDRNEFSKERVRAQLEQFNQYVLFFFFSPEIIKHCQTFVLFINKSDLLNGYPVEVEQQARALYKPLIDILMEFGEKHGISIEVHVGSAETGAGTKGLFAHLIERVLGPENYDEELSATLENIKQSGPPPHGSPSTPPAPPLRQTRTSLLVPLPPGGRGERP